MERKSVRFFKLSLRLVRMSLGVRCYALRHEQHSNLNAIYNPDAGYLKFLNKSLAYFLPNSNPSTFEQHSILNSGINT